MRELLPTRFATLKALILRVALLLVVYGLEVDSTKAQCSPTLREFFDWEVGDEFFYCHRSGDSFTGSSSKWHSRQKVINIEWQGDTLKVDLEVIRNHAGGSSASYNCDAIGALNSTPKLTTLTLIDSSGHFLNSCPGDTIPAPWGLSFIIPGNFTVVTQGWSEDPDIKAFGQQGSYLEYRSSGDSLEPSGFHGYVNSFVAKRGLGIIYENWRDGYATGGYELVGWIKDGEVFGVVYEEPPVLEPSRYSTMLEEGAIFRLVQVPGKVDRVQVFSMAGKLCFERSGSIGETVGLGFLNSGMYVIVVTTESATHRYRIIKPQTATYR